MQDHKPLWFGLAAAAIILIVLIIMYANKGQQLMETENQVRQLQAQLEEKDKKIKELEGSVASAEARLVNWEDENKELRKNVETLGKCIDRAEKIAYAESYEEAMILAGAASEPCEKSKAIISKIKTE